MKRVRGVIWWARAFGVVDFARLLIAGYRVNRTGGLALGDNR